MTPWIFVLVLAVFTQPLPSSEANTLSLVQPDDVPALVSEPADPMTDPPSVTMPGEAIPAPSTSGIVDPLSHDALELPALMAASDLGSAPEEADVSMVSELAAPEDAVAVERLPRFSGFDFGALSVSGFARVGFSFVRKDPVVDYIGQSNGFEFAAARLELSARPIDKALVHFSLDAAFGNPTDQTGVSGERVLAARDVFIQYAPFSALVIRMGQFKAPFMAETLGCDADSLFFHDSIVESGIEPPFGYAARGLGLGRQLGISISSERLDFRGIGLRYDIGVFNGNGENALFNDNNGVMPVARIELDYLRKVRLGAAVAYNKRTEGDRPDLMDEEDFSWTIDLTVTFHGIQLLAAYAQNDRSFETVSPRQDDERSRGFLAQLSWRHPKTGLEPAYRFELLEPSSLVHGTQVMHHTIGLNWKPAWLPLRLYAAYTIRIEEEVRGLTNDGFELGAQLGFF